MKYYYWESENDTGGFAAKGDAAALDRFNKLNLEKPMVLYRESDTPDGTPFIIVWEKD